MMRGRATAMQAKNDKQRSNSPASPLPVPAIDSICPHRALALISAKCHDIFNAQLLIQSPLRQQAEWLEIGL